MSQKKKHCKIPFRSKPLSPSAPVTECEATYDTLPDIALVMTMNAIINVLGRRGTRIADLDHKDRSIYKFSMIAGKPYALLTSERK